MTSNRLADGGRIKREQPLTFRFNGKQYEGYAGDTLASANHADLAATILEPFVSERNCWIVKHHGVFQGYYFFHHLGLDRNLRDRYKDSEHWKDTVEFCGRYDQNCFDRDYDTKPLEHFIPQVERLFAQPKRSIYI